MHTSSKTSFAYSMRIIIEFDNCHGVVGSLLVYFMINFSHSSIAFQLKLPQFEAVVAVCALAAAFFFFLLCIVGTKYIVICFVLPTQFARARVHFCFILCLSLSLTPSQPVAVVSTTNNLKWFGFG